MSYATIDPKRTVVLYFDMLNTYHTNDEPVVLNCAKLRDAADAANIPVAFAMANHKPGGADAAMLYSDTNYAMVPWNDPEHEHLGMNRKMVQDSWEIQILDALKPRPEDYVIKKHRWNAFYQTSLELSLRTIGVDTILLCGGAVHIGIASTAFGARDLDFNIVVVNDCCDDGLEGAQDYWMTRILPMMARIRTVDETIDMIKAGVAAS